MTDRISEIRARLRRGEYYVPHSPDDISYLLDRLAEAEAEKAELLKEVVKLAQESTKRDLELARLEVETEMAVNSVSWVSVGERLPERSVDVLVLLDTGGIRIGYIGPSSGHWCAGGFVLVPNVTHWMPSPELPEEGETK